jgi:hypothetical protein
MSVAGNLFSNFNFNLGGECIWSGKELLPPKAAECQAEGGGIEAAAGGWLDTVSSHAASTESLKHVAARGKKLHFMFSPGSTTGGAQAGIRAGLDSASSSHIMPRASIFAGLPVIEAQKFFVELYAPPRLFEPRRSLGCSADTAYEMGGG